MTSSALRLRLALALGLPFAPACKPGPDAVTPAAASPTTASPTTASPTTASPGTESSATASSPTTTPTAAAPPATSSSAAAPAASPASAATSGGRCAPDEIDERVCGLISSDYKGSGGAAPAPYAHCTQNGLALWSLEHDHVLDGWKLGSHDKTLASFRFDAAGTAAFKYKGTYQPDDPRCCYQRCNPLQALAKPRAAVPAGMKEYELCVPTPVGTKYPAATAKQCPAALRTRHTFPEGIIDPFDDAPFSRAPDDHCCYSVASKRACPPNTFQTANGCRHPSPGGRPLREAGDVVVAPTKAREDWSTTIELARHWSNDACAYAAAAWADEGAFEHASVAAFARLSIELMVHGAPADLIDAAHVAARDEIRHAQQCYGIASAFGEAVVGPGPLGLGATTPAPTLEQFAVECFRDGCVNETVGAMAVAERARRAARAELREALESIAEDEASHAELSYRILAWALRQGGAPLHRRIAEELRLVQRELADAPSVLEAPVGLDETTGLLAPQTAAEIRRRVLADVVIPCTEGLLASCHT